MGIETRPVLLGPVTYLLLGKARGERFRSADAVAAPAPGLRRNSAARWRTQARPGYRSMSLAWSWT